MRSVYARWDGTQDPILPEFEVAKIIDALSEDVLAGVGLDAALKRLLKKGGLGADAGLDELRARAEEQRREITDELNLSGPLAEIAQRLAWVIGTEREELVNRSDEDAGQRRLFLDALPANTPGAIRELMDYRFVSEDAQEAFNSLIALIQREILSTYFRNLSGAMQAMTPEDVALMREMVKALNAMIQAREKGEDYDFPGFMAAYGALFPENPRTLDELLEAMARRMVSLSRVLATLSPDQRLELEELARAVLEDLDLAFQMDQLNEELRNLMPHLMWDQPAIGQGSGATSLSGTIDAIERLSQLEELEHSLAGDYPGATLEDIDEEKIREMLGQDSVRDLRRLRQIEKALKSSGLTVHSQGRIELSPRGARRLGERALVKVFEETRKERPGEHASPSGGGFAEPTGSTRRWEFGDSGQIDVQRTIFNGIVRSASEGRFSRGQRVELRAEDLELTDLEVRTRTATALLLDLSFSMPLRGHSAPARRMALALHALIETKYPNDRLYLIGFSDVARRLDPLELTGPALNDRVYGTNMQHAFLLAGQLLAEHPRSTRQVIMVTDGEPTVHLQEGTEGQVPYFTWPPSPETVRKTLAEAMKLAASGIIINIFMLENDEGLAAFTKKLARLTAGRVFQAAGKELGQFVIQDYVRRR